MPKISTNNVQIHNKHITKDYTVDIMYNQKHHFYANIHSEYRDIVHHLGDDKLKELSIVKDYAKKYPSAEDKYQPIIVGATENEVLSKMRTALTYFTDKSIVQRNVIIVFYNSKDIQHYNRHTYNKEHPQIGLQYALTYAVETSVGDKKIYATYTPYESFGETRINIHELNLYHAASTIIDDTPENRATLEHLYTALFNLNKKLGEFTSTPEKLLELISSNQKLLN